MVEKTELLKYNRRGKDTSVRVSHTHTLESQCTVTTRHQQRSRRTVIKTCVELKERDGPATAFFFISTFCLVSVSAAHALTLTNTHSHTHIVCARTNTSGLYRVMGRAGVRYESVSVRLFLKAVTSTNQNQRPAATHITQEFELCFGCVVPLLPS